MMTYYYCFIIIYILPILNYLTQQNIKTGSLFIKICVCNLININLQIYVLDILLLLDL